MTESSQEHVSNRAVLIQQGNELSEFVGLLNELAVPIETRPGKLPAPKDLAGAAVVIVPGNRLIESGTPNLSLWPHTIAVIDDSSKTLAAHLNRLGVTTLIRRPIHPRTLRLLLLHEIYRGPERRRRKRILIGHPVSVRSGLFKQHATLLELSPSGARIELASAPKIGSKMRLSIGKELTHGKALNLQVQVVRCIRPAGENGRGDTEIGVALINAKREQEALAPILDRFAKGPASWEGKPAAPERPRAVATPATDTPPPNDTNDPKSRLPRTFAPASPSRVKKQKPAEPIQKRRPAARIVHARTPVRKIESDEWIESIVEAPLIDDPCEVDLASAADSSERRSDPRVPYAERVVALGVEAAHVLIGRDLSLGGMRIASNESVAVGDLLRVALHCGADMEPLVVLANALRDDGEDGTVLTFQGLSNGQREGLEKILEMSSPIHAVPDDLREQAGGCGPIVLGEMLETVERGDLAVDSEEQISSHLDSIFDAGESVKDTR